MPFMGTFHGICVKILRQDGDYIGIPRNFIIFDSSDSQAAVKQASKQLHLDEKTFPPKLLASCISSAKNAMLNPLEYAEFASGPTQEAAAKAYPLYEKILIDSAALDFDDLIIRTVQLLEAKSDVQLKWQTLFRYIMVDEYQDTNSSQYRLIQLLINHQRNIAVVGDDWQSVYGFRGADYRNILNFERDFNDSSIIKLEQNYRSTKYILDAAHSVITKNAQRSDKKLWTDAANGLPVQIVQVNDGQAEAEYIVRKIQLGLENGYRRYRDFAILYRTNAQSRAIEEVLIRHGLPYRIVGGVRFYDRREIKNVLAYLRLLVQPDDRISFERIVNIPVRGVGAVSLRHFYDWQLARGMNLGQALDQVDNCESLTAKARQALSELSATMTILRDLAKTTSLSGLIDSLLRRIEYLKFLDDGTAQGEARIENVRELLSVAQEYQETGLEGFLEEVTLISDLDSVDFDSDAVMLMTLHASKGLEFPVVFMTGLEETIFPHSRALYDQNELEEERRLCYVGMTRAKQELYMLYTAHRLLYGGMQHNLPSRFLSDIKEGFQYSSGSLSSQFSGFGQPNNNILRQSDPTLDNGELKYSIDISEGALVQHQVFGIGTVLAVNGETATVHFQAGGVKVLNLSFAPIEKI